MPVGPDQHERLLIKRGERGVADLLERERYAAGARRGKDRVDGHATIEAQQNEAASE